jgi:hypothetical protein
MSRQNYETLTCKVIITDEERLRFSSEQAAANQKRHRLEDELKKFKKQMDYQIVECEAIENINADRISNGYEFRPVKCRINYNFDTRMKSWVREDTGEIEKEEIMTEKEIQEELDI